MEQEEVWRKFNSLPPEAQRQVLDFILFLQARYKGTVKDRKKRAMRNMTKEPFIGIWQDREDLQDSEAWVRKVRDQEWG